LGRLKRLAIFYFSGTGNTQLLAEQYAASFRHLDVAVDLIKIEDYTRTRTSPEINGYDAVGLGYPIHAFNAPRIVYEFINLLPPGAGRFAFIFKSPGDPFANGGSTLPVRRRLMAKQYEVVHESMLVMPANFLQKLSPELSRLLYDVACRRIAIFTGEILKGVRRLQQNRPSERIYTTLSWFEQLGIRLLRLLYYVRPSCTGCGLCAERCPTANIEMSKGRPNFGWRCLCCLRCVYLCPVGAIGIRGCDALLFKDGYNIRRIINDVRNIPVNIEELKGCNRRLLAYVKQSNSIHKLCRP